MSNDETFANLYFGTMHYQQNSEDPFSYHQAEPFEEIPSSYKSEPEIFTQCFQQQESEYQVPDTGLFMMRGFSNNYD